MANNSVAWLSVYRKEGDIYVVEMRNRLDFSNVNLTTPLNLFTNTQNTNLSLFIPFTLGV